MPARHMQAVVGFRACMFRFNLSHAAHGSPIATSAICPLDESSPHLAGTFYLPIYHVYLVAKGEKGGGEGLGIEGSWSGSGSDRALGFRAERKGKGKQESTDGL